jgi:WD40 repeat protein
LTRALVQTAVTVVLIAVGMGFVYVPPEAEGLWGPPHVSVVDCHVSATSGTLTALSRSHSPSGLEPMRFQLSSHSLTASKEAAAHWPLVPRSMSATREGLLLVGGWDGSVYEIDPRRPDRPPALVVRDPERQPNTIQSSPDGRWLITRGASFINVWCLESRTLRWRRDVCGIRCQAIHANSQILYFGLHDGRVLELDLESGTALRSLGQPGPSTCALSISPDGRWLAMMDMDHIDILDLDTGAFLSSCAIHSQPGYDPVQFVTFSPCSKLLVTAADGGTRLAVWDLATGERKQTLDGHDGFVLGAAFVDGRTLCSWANDGTIRTWDLLTANERKVISLPAALRI